MPVKETSNPWALAQEHLRALVDEHSFKNWFSQTDFASYEACCLVLSVPSRFFAEWLRDHYMDAILEAVRRVLPDVERVSFRHGAPPPREAAPENARRPLPEPARKRAAAVQHAYNGFNPRYTFEHFVVGSGNRFANAAARAVAESPGRAYNPLFLYGGTGLGKTHLMQAIGQELLRRDPGANVVFISTEQFTNQLIDSIAKKATQRFREKYRKVDVILIDDVHFLAGKEATQEEFFHTFNELYDARKQIVLSSDRGPKEIERMEERLVTRFEWGLVTDITPPDQETREAILQNKAREDGVSVPIDVIRYIATHVTSNIRELEGAFITALAYCRLTEQAVSLPLVQEVLRDLIGSDKIRPVTIELVMRVVAEQFDVRIADLRGRSRQRHVAYPRQLAMYLCKALIPSLSLKDVGEAFGGKDHTTVLYACDKLASANRNDPAARQTLEQLTKKIRSA
ncbi:MAG TPA: chromosomal replication initiator protein DnaA [Candidatus Hydrogenedentes bacterium]|nr:chromosomal replication initiator protein DnaA [Candidatus Hydrogenedentota bacterium]HNT86298.1 chromosomal replication initiator protein DnaA [Candidatus Hydrogenedentota bacterium]